MKKIEEIFRGIPNEVIRPEKLLVILILIIPALSSAQFDFGVFTGVVGNRISGDAPNKFRYQEHAGPALGISLHYYIKDDVRIGFQPAYSFNRPRLEFRDRELDEYRDSVFLDLDYVSLPLFLDIISDNTRWHYVAGIDFQLSVRRESEAGGETSSLEDELTLFNPVIVLGLGRRIRIGQSIMSIDLRFGQGLLNVSSRENDVTSVVPRIKTSSLSLLVLYHLNSHAKKK